VYNLGAPFKGAVWSEAAWVGFAEHCPASPAPHLLQRMGRFSLFT